MVEVLKTQIQMGASPSRIVALTWVHHLFECLQDKVNSSGIKQNRPFELFF